MFAYEYAYVYIYIYIYEYMHICVYDDKFVCLSVYHIYTIMYIYSSEKRITTKISRRFV